MATTQSSKKQISIRQAKRNKLFFALIVAILLVCAGLIVELINNRNPGSVIWEGYYTVLFAKPRSMEIDYGELARRLRGIEVITEASSREVITHINGFEKVPIKDMRKRLDSLDPRFDDYLQNIGRFFHPDSNHEAFYISANQHPLVSYFALLSFFGQRHIDFYFADYKPEEKLGFALMALLYVFFVTSVLGGSINFRAQSFIGVLPWLFVFMRGNIIDLAIFILIYPRLTIVIDRIGSALSARGKTQAVLLRTNESLVRDLIVIASLVIASCIPLLFFRLERAIIPSSMAIFVDLLIAAIYFQRFAGIRQKKAPRAIVKNILHRKAKTDIRFARKMLIIVLVSTTLFGAIILYYLTQPFGGVVEIAYPSDTVTDKPYSFEGLESLQEQKSPGSLPDISDYITHSAFQEGFSQGAKYKFAGKTSVIVPIFTKTNGPSNKIVQAQKPVLFFDEGWLRGVIRKIENGSIERLLVTQGNPACVASGNITAITRSRFSMWITIIFFTVISGIAYFIGRYLTFKSNYAKKSIRERYKNLPQRRHTSRGK